MVAHSVLSLLGRWLIHPVFYTLICRAIDLSAGQTQLQLNALGSITAQRHPHHPEQAKPAINKHFQHTGMI